MWAFRYYCLGCILLNLAWESQAQSTLEQGKDSIRDRAGQKVVMAGSPRLERHRGLLFYKEGLFSGWVETVDSDGVLRARDVFVDGKRHGNMQRWYADGQLESVREYRENRKHGKHEGWYPDGQLKFQMAFSHGVYSGRGQEWYRSGILFASFQYVDGKEEGLQRVWDEAGKLRSNYVVRNGRRYGLVGAKPCVNTPSISTSPTEGKMTKQVLVK